MTFTEEMLAEDEKKWGYRNILAELKYCGNHMRDRKNMTNQDIRFYAYIMRKAYHMLIESEPIVRCKDCKHQGPDRFANDSGCYVLCRKGHGWKPDNWFCADGERK